MKRKLFAVLLAVVATLSLTVFGVTALAETPTPNNEITAVDYENLAGGYGMGLAVKGFVHTGQDLQQARLARAVEAQNADLGPVEVRKGDVLQHFFQ